MLKMFRKSLNNRKGFTLVELLVVVAIIGILAAIAIPKFTSANATARGAKLQADLRTIDSALQLYNASAGSYPAALATLTAGSATLAAVPTPPAGDWLVGAASGNGSGKAYGISGGRAVYDSATTVEMLK